MFVLSTFEWGGIRNRKQRRSRTQDPARQRLPGQIDTWLVAGTALLVDNLRVRCRYRSTLQGFHVFAMANGWSRVPESPSANGTANGPQRPRLRSASRSTTWSE